MEEFRIERDSMGEVKVPSDAMYGAQTRRALDNFRISGVRFPRAFIRALGLIKAAAAEVNAGLGLLDGEVAGAVCRAAEEVAEGLWDEHFPLDVFQTGSGTSTNMNANEVIARRASQILKGCAVHPNDHVNMCQSSNDVIPSAIHLSTLIEAHGTLLPGMRMLEDSLRARAGETMAVLKTGRTHLMDAMPLTLGQEVGGWAHRVGECAGNVESALGSLCALALGGTAVGTGVNAHPEFGKRAAGRLAERTGLPLRETANHFASQSAMDAAAEMSGRLKTIASVLMKISDDLRWLNSGPLAGLGEISLPALQPGSSIMPGKVNPVVCEAVMMACAQTIANDLAVTIGNERGNFELNTMLPLIARNLLESITLMGNSASALAGLAVRGFDVNAAKVSEAAGRNPMLATALSPVIGYDKAAEVAKKAYAEGRPIRDVAMEMTGMGEAELDRLLDPKRLTNPH